MSYSAGRIKKSTLIIKKLTMCEQNVKIIN